MRKRSSRRPVIEVLEYRQLLSGTVVTWSGGVDSQWNTPGNWVGGAVPAAGDGVSFPTNSSAYNVNLASAETVGTLTMGNVILTGSTLTLDGNVTSDATHQSAILTPITLGTNINVTVPLDLTLGGVIDDGGHGFGLSFSGEGEVDMGPYALSNGVVAIPFNATPLTSTYTGTTSLDANALFLDANLASSVSISNAGYLTGGPSIGGFVGADTELDAGDTNTGEPTAITIANGLTLDDQSNFGSLIDSPTSYRSAIVNAGTINITNATLFDHNTDNVISPTGTVLTLIKNNTGHAVVGTFVGDADGSSVTLGGQAYVISYEGGASGQDVTLTAGTASQILLSTSKASITYGNHLTLKATVTGTGGTPSGTVHFFDGSTAIGDPVALVNGVASINTAALLPGTHTINAVYSGDSTFIPTDARADGTTVSEKVVAVVEITKSPDVSTTKRTAALSVLATDTQKTGAAGLKYTWKLLASPSGAKAPKLSANGTNAAKNTTATFYKDGGYTFSVTAADPAGYSFSTDVHVTVKQKATTLRLSPHHASVNAGDTLQTSAVVLDQFNHALRTSFTTTYAVKSGVGMISSSGLFSAGTITGKSILDIDADGLDGTLGVTVV